MRADPANHRDFLRFFRWTEFLGIDHCWNYDRPCPFGLYIFGDKAIAACYGIRSAYKSVGLSEKFEKAPDPAVARTDVTNISGVVKIQNYGAVTELLKCPFKYCRPEDHCFALYKDQVVFPDSEQFPQTHRNRPCQPKEFFCHAS